MTLQPPAGDTLLELYDAIAQRQLRDAGAEVAAAIAHAVGTPLNVISGRAELIRHDPSSALKQVVRIEEQVKKLATGLRQLVDYLAVPDPHAPQQSASAAGKPSTKEADAGRAAGELTVVDAKSVLDDVVALTDALARANHVEVLVEGGELGAARVERWHALGTLAALVSQAIRHCSRPATSEGPARLRIGGGISNQGVVFELVVPGLALLEGWQLEHFQTRPAATGGSEFYQTTSICAAVVRGHGGKLAIESAPDGSAIVVRFSCIKEAS